MPTFQYLAYTEEGRSRRGRLEALDVKEVRERLLKEGLYVREARMVGQGRRGGLEVGARAVMYRELSALLRAGLPLDRALGLLSENPELCGGGEALARVCDEVREGVSLSVAMGVHVGGVVAEERAVLSAGEASGRLAGVCEELAQHVEEAALTRDQVRTALVYPGLVGGLALVVMGLMVGFLLPVYDRLLSGMNQPMPGLTRGVLALGRMVRHPMGGAMVWMVVGGGVVWVRRMWRKPGGILVRGRYRLPVLGRALAALARARFARTLSLLLGGGVGLPEALRTAGEATGSPWLAAAAGRVSEGVSQGGHLAECLAGVPILGEELPGWAMAGEASGGLSELMEHAARGQQRAWERGLRRALALLEPIMIVGVGVLILVVALAVLLPMLRMNRGLGG